MNYIDIILLVILLVYALDGLRRGFLNVVLELLIFIISVILSLKFYLPFSGWLIKIVALPEFLKNIVSFILLWAIFEIILLILGNFIQQRIPFFIRNSPINKIAGFLPSLLKGWIILSVILFLLIGLPTPGFLKEDINHSKIGSRLISEAAGFEAQAKNIFGGVVEEALTFLTLPKESKETLQFNFKEPKLTVDEKSEEEMLRKVNIERGKIGLQPLQMEEKLREVARAHSKDMWERKYFSHISPDGSEPLDRVKRTGLTFTVVGENLALAPNVDLAHIGLMNSEGHRSNILGATYRRVGIGVIDGGVYGKMFTQNFTD